MIIDKSNILVLFFLIFFALISYLYFTSEKILETVEGNATFYGEFFHGRITTSGEEYNMNDMTAAHPSFPFGTKVRVINLENNKEVIVKINDRPKTKSKSRIDLSKGAFKVISELDSGRVPVRMEVLKWGKE